jgi:uncharacterized membrane protein
MTLHDPPYQGLFTILEGRLDKPQQDGFGADYDGTLIIDEVLYVAHEGFGCNFDWSTFRYRVLGNEPFWSADITATSILLRQMGEDQRNWTLTQEHETDHAAGFSGDADGNDPVTLEIQRKACRDTMSSAFFGYTATLRVGESVLTGCALVGSKATEAG